MSKDILSVYYDGTCPICRREIGWYGRMRGAEAIRWVDVTAGHDLGPGLDRATALGRFHVRRPDGALVSGAAAFAEIWARLNALRPLARVARTRVGGAVLERLYRGFLKILPFLRRSMGQESLRDGA